jgi:hypothetical protein
MVPIHWVAHKRCCVFKNTPHPLLLLYSPRKLALFCKPTPLLFFFRTPGGYIFIF